ncbi:nuclear transport factor 2 family protein [Prosthecobacter sp.]|uniref:nuclear transport factor 2 family protein n=1 Tax=Prosthecobacter sp. TaxID=1965333 RepID=UPI002489A4F5|nr:nuclear transport factor 2 family protein [Prosthecobacter sp.]MDI1313456.1 nuclear transport factor 2 family protein [Prosthecobacter sp.]
MKTLLTSLICLVSFISFAEDAPLAAVQAADDVRVAAMKSPDRDKLSAIFSDELRYAHSSGVVDTKASFIESLLKGSTKYLAVDYVERQFTFPAPDIALMTGSANLKIGLETGPIEPTLAFLAVWRLEGGQWRFLAWQSCKLAPPTK